MGKVEGLLVLLAIIMLLFGAKKLPELAKGVGESVRELKKGFTSGEDESTK
jgi:sec-independent protein translocase protein TatA